MQSQSQLPEVHSNQKMLTLRGAALVTAAIGEQQPKKQVKKTKQDKGMARVHRPHNPNKTNTLLDLHLPRGKLIPAPTCQKYLGPDLAKVLPGYSHSERRLTFVSPTAKQQLTSRIVMTALKGLGGVVGQAAELDASFDKDEYIINMAAKAKQVHDECLKRHDKYKKTILCQ